ncbi:uncharacterized protein PV09_07839 [Verruconis gallopava]|uniref:COP9 signalosome complex subunit 6 n=1 Tax=Verruconis gallopava TaxID=253628 RepID=A0A0D1XEM9_9PEZI|nr:uncharacterized protein PV09_07839 [Verruconis gallopava]KIW00646.1 hypothetical protein PV09_07839 [Verruconis gallopava]
MAAAPSNPLLASTTPSDTSPEIQLHPLVILTISDTVARRTIRKQTGPIAGAILGQQNGRQITMEVAFDSKVEVGPDGQVQFDSKWFEDRLQMYKEVYKNPQLDLVGWWTLGAAAGPEQRHLPAQMQIQTEYSLESAPLLLFHPEMVEVSSGTEGKLPLTIYETVWTSDNNGMDVDGGERNHNLKYREVRYTIETSEAEMISVDFVARGGGNATAVDTSFSKVHNAGDANSKASAAAGAKGKSKDDSAETQKNGISREAFHLTTEEDELLATLTAKASAIKMLQSRLNLLTAYLKNLPPSYLSDASIPLDPSKGLELNHPLLRSINALLARLPLLTPPDTVSFTRESEQTASDVELVSLLSSLTRTVQDAKELGRKWNLAEPRKSRAGPVGGGFGASALSEFIDEEASGVGMVGGF